jgi:glycine cleavage system H protein
MSEVKAGFGYSEEHEWAEARGTIVRIGITDFAQSQLGDIVFVELPEVGISLDANDTMGTIESVKTVSDLYCPVGGRVVNVNEELLDAPQKVNEDPYGEGWIIEIEVGGEASSEVAALLSAEAYAAYIANK